MISCHNLHSCYDLDIVRTLLDLAPYFFIPNFTSRWGNGDNDGMEIDDNEDQFHIDEDNVSEVVPPFQEIQLLIVALLIRKPIGPFKEMAL